MGLQDLEVSNWGFDSAVFAFVNFPFLPTGFKTIPFRSLFDRFSDHFSGHFSIAFLITFLNFSHRIYSFLIDHDRTHDFFMM